MSTSTKENKLGLAGGIIGIALAATSFIFSWFLAPLYVIGTAVGIALSSIGLSRSMKSGSKKGMAITGLATGIPTFIWTLIWSFALIGAAASSSN